MLRALRILRLWCVVALITIVSLGTTAYGHARREVGPYRFVVGFLVEPAYEGLKNVPVGARPSPARSRDA